MHSPLPHSARVGVSGGACPRPGASLRALLFLRLTAALLAASPLAAEHLRVYMLGNSLTDDVLYDGFKNLAAAGGQTVTLGSQRIPGASIRWLWTNPGSGFTETAFGYYPQALAGFTWDALTLQPFSDYSGELSHARYFASALRGTGTFGPNPPVAPGPSDPTGRSPEGAVYLYAQWPSNLLAGWVSDRWVASEPTNRDTASYYEAMVRELRTAEAPTRIFLIPVGHVFHELHQLTRAGRVPGVDEHADWMLDGIHLNDRGSYVAGLTFYSTLYRDDPRGQPPVLPYQVTAEQAAVIQEAVWKVVSRHPLSGLAETLTITSPSVPDALAGQPYSAALATELGQGDVTLSLAGGALPEGLALSPLGAISGAPATAGTYDFTARAQDAAGHLAERSFLLFVRSDDPPRVATPFLPAAAVGTPYRTVLRHTGGFGPISWKILNGDLPRGLSLSPDGVIAGTPLSVPGAYRLTLAVTDSVPATDTAPFQLLLQAEETGTLTASPWNAAPSLDGLLAEPDWTLPLTADRIGSGTPDNAVAYGVRWDSAAVWWGIRVTDPNVQPTGDSVHLFLDGKHDREAVFNADDRHLQIFADGTWTEWNSRPEGLEARAVITASGYDVEVRVPFTNLGVGGDGQSLSLGFDLAVEDRDAPDGPVSRLVWRAVDPSAPSPAVLGNLLLRAGPVSANRLRNGQFSDINLNRPAYPAKASTDRAGVGWVANGVPSRPFATVDSTGYGFPDLAVSAYGVSPGVCLYQVLADARATTGRGFLRFDVRYASADIAYRLYGYNGDPAAVNARIGVESQQHPAKGGTPDATLLSGTLAAVPVAATWREVALPVDFGAGYDYLIFAFSGNGQGIHVDARVDNVELGPAPREQESAGALLPPATDAILEADLSGANPAQHLPWTKVRGKAAPLTYGGLRAGTGISPVAGDDGVFYSQNHGSTRSTLAYALQNQQYLSFTLGRDDGGTFDLAGALLQFRIDRRGDTSSARRFAVFSDATGFTEDAALFVSGEVLPTGLQPVAGLLPDRAALRGLTQIEFRLYGYDGQYAQKTVILKSLALGGRADPLDPLDSAFRDWSATLDWRGADSSPSADPNRNGISNLLEFALDLPDPAGPTAPGLLPAVAVDSTAPAGPWLTFTHRRSRRGGFSLDLLDSPDLVQWADRPADGDATRFSVLDPDPDGDGSAELVQWRVRLTGPQRFLRLGLRR